MEQIIIVIIFFLFCIICSFLLGKHIEKQKIIKEALKLGEKIDKIISANNCIDKHEWINWLHKRRK